MRLRARVFLAALVVGCVSLTTACSGSSRHSANSPVSGPATTTTTATTIPADPTLDVPVARLAAALHCTPGIETARTTPVLLANGTGVDGAESWRDLLQPVLRRDGYSSCYVTFPEHTTGDMQVAAEYVVYAVREMVARARRPIALYGISQGAVLLRIALTYWPSLGPYVTDAVLLAGPQHGSTASFGDCARHGCVAAAWQRLVTSRLLRALNARDETPGPTAYTTVRTLDDTTVVPVAGPKPTSSLSGASNLVVQAICPNRVVSHIALEVDAVAYAILVDALTHPGPARASRINRAVCRAAYAGGQNLETVKPRVDALLRDGTLHLVAGHKLHAEPPLAHYIAHGG